MYRFMSTLSSATSTTVRNLASMNEHFVIATKRSGYKPEHKPYIESWARALLVLQSTPMIVHPRWRKDNPLIMSNYMGKRLIEFNSDELYQEVKRIHDDTMNACPSVNSFILRSNDGKTAEKAEEQDLIA